MGTVKVLIGDTMVLYNIHLAKYSSRKNKNNIAMGKQQQLSKNIHIKALTSGT